MLNGSIVTWCLQDQERRVDISDGANRDMGIQDNIAETWEFMTTWQKQEYKVTEANFVVWFSK